MKLLVGARRARREAARGRRRSRATAKDGATEMRADASARGEMREDVDVRADVAR
jgi:hypothetical protein